MKTLQNNQAYTHPVAGIDATLTMESTTSRIVKNAVIGPGKTGKEVELTSEQIQAVWNFQQAFELVYNEDSPTREALVMKPGFLTRPRIFPHSRKT